MLKEIKNLDYVIAYKNIIPFSSIMFRKNYLKITGGISANIKYAIDYDKNNKIELKSYKDSFASAANYMNLIGWKKSAPCFVPIDLKENIPIKFLNA